MTTCHDKTLQGIGVWWVDYKKVQIWWKLPVLHSVIGVVCNISFFSLLKKSVRTNLEW